MICPKCGYSESNHLVTKSDKEHYLDFWGFTLGTPEAEEAWKQKEESAESYLIDAHVMTANGPANEIPETTE